MANNVYYSGNPINVTYTSNKANVDGVTMVRVVCVVSRMEGSSFVGDEKLVCTVSKKTENNPTANVARFNLSETIDGMMSRLEEFGTDETDNAPKRIDNTYGVIFIYYFYEVWYQGGEQNNKPKTQDEIHDRTKSLTVYSGKLSDYRINCKDVDALTFVSMKQSSFGEEYALKGFPYLISYGDRGNVERFRSLEEIRNSYYELTVPGNIMLIDYNPLLHRPIIFRNSFGELESCVAICRESIDVKVSQDVYVTSRQIYDGQRTQLVGSYDDKMQVKLSSGPVSPMWAQWWAYEPLRSRRAWIFMPIPFGSTSGKWVPCSITAESNTILDRSNATAGVSFVATLDWQGGLL